MHHSRRLLAALAAAAAISALPASAAQAATKRVFAGPPRPVKAVPDGADVTKFLPRTIKVAKGAPVEFHFRGFHTITFLGKQKMPDFFITDGKKVEGRNDAAGRPFWFNGLDRLLVNPAVAFPVGDAEVDSGAIDSSGVPQGSETPPYKVTFPKAGTFKYLCLVHPKMRGKVVVLKKKSKVPSTRSDDARVARQLTKAVKQAKRRVGTPAPGGANVLAGNSTKDVEILRFFPQDLTVKAGTTVRWRAPHAHDFHTVTLGPADYVNPIAQAFIAPDTSAPQGGPPTLLAHPLAVFPSEAPGSPAPVYDGSHHGNGFLSSGIIEGDPAFPGPAEWSATFTKPGTYAYICLVHGSGMSGKVTVTQ